MAKNVNGRRKAMRERITIQEKATTQDAFGQPVPSWSAVVGLEDIPASFEAVSGNESLRGSQVQADVIGLFYVRNTPTLIYAAQHRVLWNGKSYGISNVRSFESDHAGGVFYKEIHVKAIE